MLMSYEVTGRQGVYLGKSPYRILWHPAFYASTEVELKGDRQELELISEYNLSKQPLRIDLVIINKRWKTVKIENEIGHIMRKYNIVEYKGPGDSLTIDDFYKTLGYVSLYKCYGKCVNEISVEEITMSIFASTYPREMFKELKRTGYKIKEKYPGIYYIKGNIPVPVQVIVIGELDKDKHSSLRILSNNAKEVDVRRFLEETETLELQANRDNIDAILQASVGANFDLYDELRRRDEMCEALRRLMKDEIEEEIELKYSEGMRAGRQEGRQEGIHYGNVEALRNIMSKLSYTAEQAMDLLEIPQPQRAMFAKQLS